MMRRFAPLFLFALGCEAKMEASVVKKMINDQFNTANPTSGILGYELFGKGEMFKAPAFSNECLESKDLAFRDFNSPGKGRISPTYEAQRWITSATSSGYCIDMGSDLSLDINSVDIVTDQSQWDIQKASVSFKIVDPSPWFECLLPEYLEREIKVQNIDGKQEIDPDFVEKLRFLPAKNSCVQPISKSTPRGEYARPSSPAPTPATLDQVKKLISAYDGHLKKGEFEQAFSMVTCVDLYEAKWGRCAVSEVIAHGPMVVGSDDALGHTPWTDGQLKSTDGLSKIKPDKEDPTLAHVFFKGLRSKETQSISVVWRDGAWTLLGARHVRSVSGLLRLEFINDLHDKKIRDIFERRLTGEKIDRNGNSTDPYADQK